MRFVIYGVFLSAWVIMWWWTYTCHIKNACCPERNPAVTEIPIVELDMDETRPVVFQWSKADPVVYNNFNLFRDSLLNLVRDDQLLEVTGLYYRDESNSSGAENLGLARSAAAKSILRGLRPDQIRLRSEIADLEGDVRDSYFEALRFRVLENNAFVQEVDDRALIYFPFNSTKKVSNATIDAYLEKVANRLQSTNERVQLTGHTDDMGTNESNYYLGLWRASAIEDILISRGVPQSRVEVDSKGEISPITSNRTHDGKKRNRRVELRLTNSK